MKDGKILGRNVPVDAEKKKSILYLDENDLRPMQPIKLTALQWHSMTCAILDINKRLTALEEAKGENG